MIQGSEVKARRKTCETKDQRIRRLQCELEESVRLQSHYAWLLNAYDGGTRLQFNNIYEWSKRLKECRGELDG